MVSFKGWAKIMEGKGQATKKIRILKNPVLNILRGIFLVFITQNYYRGNGSRPTDIMC